MTYIEAALLGIIEGLTEFLPISSTGHLYLSRHLMKIADSDFTKAFDIIIQSGAMLAVIWHCKNDFWAMTLGTLKKDKTQITRLLNLFLAFLPAAVVGFLAGSWIKGHLFSPGPIIGALIVGGFAMWLIEHSNKARPIETQLNEKNLGAKECFYIGLFQCLALWPGTSRAMATILGGRFLGLSPRAAAQFSFLLAVPTLLAASGYDLLKNGKNLISNSENILVLTIGILTSFVVAHLVIKAFMSYLAKRDLKPFAYYRILAGLALWAYFSL